MHLKDYMSQYSCRLDCSLLFYCLHQFSFAVSLLSFHSLFVKALFVIVSLVSSFCFISRFFSFLIPLWNQICYLVFSKLLSYSVYPLVISLFLYVSYLFSLIFWFPQTILKNDWFLIYFKIIDQLLYLIHSKILRSWN